MQATNTTTHKFIGATSTRFVVPAYQRNYAWTKKECGKLLDDIIEFGKNPDGKEHYLQSFSRITNPDYKGTDVEEQFLIDGQQRIATLTLIYAAMADFAKIAGDPEYALEIYDTVLTNPHSRTDEKLKLILRPPNSLALEEIVFRAGKNLSGIPSKLADNYRYLARRINDSNYGNIKVGLTRLHVVDHEFHWDRDDPQRVFESINSTGTRLNVSELITGYLISGMSRRNQDRVYASYTAPIRANASRNGNYDPDPTVFFKHYLAMKTGKKTIDADLYDSFKKAVPVGDYATLLPELKEMLALSDIYNRIINPENEGNREISHKLHLLDLLGTGVAHPFIMKTFLTYEKGAIDYDCLLSVLNLIQSYLWRRTLCGSRDNSLNSVFPPMCTYVDGEQDYLKASERFLLMQAGENEFPDDARFEEAIQNAEIGLFKKKSVLAYAMTSLENYGNRNLAKIDFSKNHVERIFPQKPHTPWKEKMDQEDYDTFLEQYLHTLGNITVSANSGDYEGLPFVEKRNRNDSGNKQGYSHSKLWINRDLSEMDDWNQENYYKRIERIVEASLKIWPIPQRATDAIGDDCIMGEAIDVFDIESAKHKKIEYVVFMGKTMTYETVSDFFAETFKTLYREYPDQIENAKGKGRAVITRNPKQIKHVKEIGKGVYVSRPPTNDGIFNQIKKALEDTNPSNRLLVKFF